MKQCLVSSGREDKSVSYAFFRHHLKKLVLCFLLFLTWLLNPLDVSAQSTPTVWNGPRIVFTKANHADFNLEANQDRITPTTWITRQNAQGLYNAYSESGFYNWTEPSNTRWAYGTLDNYASLTYQTWSNWNGWNPRGMIGRDAVLHLISENIYIGIKFLSWTSGNMSGIGNGGGFSYERTTGIIDTEAPQIKVKDITVTLDANGNATVAPADLDNGTTDNSGNYTLAFSISGKICATANEHGEVTLAAPTGTVITSINFASYGMPDGACGNFTIGWCHAPDSKSIVENLALGKNAVTISASNGVFGDPCNGTGKRLYIEATYGTPTPNLSYTCNNLGKQNVTVYATDARGNTASAVAVVTVVDNFKPTITAPAAVTVKADAGKNTASGVVLGNPVTADNCALGTTTNNAPATFPIGNTTVTWTVTDAVGNTATAEQIVTVQANVPPAPSTPDLLNSTDSGVSDTDHLTNVTTPIFVGTAIPNSTVKLYSNSTVLGTSTTDGSGNWMVTSSRLADGTYSITARAVDAAGNESSASSPVSVTIDTKAPETSLVTTPPAFTNATSATFAFESSEYGNMFNVSVDGGAYTSAASPYTLNGLSEGAHTLQVQALDMAGNVDPTPASYTWSIDQTAPSVTGITRLDPATAATNATTVTYLVSFSEAVTGVDLNDFYLTATGTAAGAIASVGAQDNKSFKVSVSSVGGTGTMRLDVKASSTGIMDAVGNELSASYTSGEVYTIDTTNPTVTSLSVPANGTYGAAQHLGFTIYFDEVVTVTGTPTLSLTIGSVSREAAYVSGSGSTALNFRYTVQHGELDMNGITLGGITLNGGTITDVVSNAAALSLSGVIPSTAGVLVDAVAPTLQTVTIASSNNDITKARPGDVVTLSLEASEPIAQPTVVIAGKAATVTASTTTAYTATYTLTAVDAEGAVPFTITYQDLTGNAGTAVVSATTNGSSVIFDKTAPVVKIKDITIQLDNAGAVTITEAAVDNGSSDNYGIAAMTLSQTSFDCSNVGTNNVVLTVTDLSGNTSTATATVTVVDPIKPTITAPAAITVNTDAGKNTASGVVLGTPTIADNCFGARVTNNAPAAFPVGSTTVTWTVTDAAGNIVTATQVVTVEDKEAPVPTIATLPTIKGECSATVSAPTAIDNVAGTVTGTTTDPTSYTEQGVYTITWTYHDGNGNSSTQTQQVVVDDVTAPIVGTIASKSIAIPAGQSANWNMYRFDFTDPLPAGAVVTGITLTYSGRDQGWGGTGASARIIVSDTHIGSNQFFGNSQNFTINFSGDVPGYVYGGDNFMRVDFDTWPGWVAYFEGGTLSINYIVKAHAATLPAITGECSVTVTTIPEAYDKCGGFIVGTTSDPLIYTEPGTYTITWSFDDENGNISTATQQVIVTDTQKPQVITQNITVALDATGKATITPALIDNGSTDNCSIPTDGYSLSKTEFTCVDLGANTVTLTVTDVNGNSQSATATVTVVDPIKPTITAPAAITVNTDAGKNTASNVTLGAPTIADNCSGGSVTNDAPAIFPLGNTAVTWTVTDAAGNTATAMQVVTVKDAEAPVPTIATLPTISGECSATVSAPTATDNVAGTVTGTTTSPLSYSAQGTYTITWTYVDAAGNQATQTQQVVVKDVTAPVFTPVSAIVKQTDANVCGAVVSFNLPVASDNCAGPVIITQTAGLASGAQFPVGKTTNTFVAIDAAGNTSAISFDVTVTDTQKPTVVSRNITVQLDEQGQVAITAGQLDGGITDNCGISSIVLDKSEFGCSDLGANVVTLTVTDVNGNIGTATATVTVEDKTAPVARAKNLTVQLNAEGKATITPAMVDDTSSDLCGEVKLALDKTIFDCSKVGANEVVLTVTDKSGNISTATAIVTVEDKLAPVVRTRNITVQLDATGKATITADQINNSSRDNCSIASIVLDKTDFDCSNQGDNPVRLTVTDVNGNSATATAVVKVVDTFAPVAVAQDVTLYLSAEGTVSLTPQQVNNNSSDNCAIALLNLDKTAFDCSSIGKNTVTLTVRDASGNQSTATATVTVLDKVAPVVRTRDITVQLDAEGKASITAAHINDGSSDNCGIETMSLDKTAFDCSQTGANTVTLTVTDKNGNSATATATVTVQESIPPVVLTRNITLALDESGKATITADQVNNGSSDNCGIESITLDKTTFDCSNVGENTVTLTVTDKSGNKSTATALITVEDKLAPTAIARNLTVQLDENGRATITAAQVNNGSSDNCGIATLSLDKASFSCGNLGENRVTLTVTDKSGNQSKATATVIVEDKGAPVVITQNITVQLDASGVAAITVADIDKGSGDNCSISSISLSKTAFDCSNLGKNEVVLTVTDGSGNEATGTAIVTVEDKLAPVVAVKNITVQLNAAGKASITAADLNKGSTDNCGIASLSLDRSTFDCEDVGENKVTLTVTDASGNQSTAVAIVTIEDKVAPMITAPAALVVNVDPGKMTASNVALGEPATADNCSVASMSNDAPTEFPTGTTTVTWTVTDASGNTATATQTVTVRRDVVSVAKPAQISVPIRTAYASVPLPSTVTVTYSDGATEAIGVVWAQGSYNGLVAGTYTLSGQLTLAAGTTNLLGRVAEVAVIVEPNKVPTALAFSATSFKPEAAQADVIGTLTTTDPDDTEFVYTLVSGSGDTHNSLFEIRGDQVYLKSNKGLSGMTSFTIRVRSTDPYLNTIERTFTLTKEAYDRTVDQLKIVNAFSPNGDGINDNWTIPELRFYNEVYIQVFDRSGVRVFETNDPEKGWDGRGPNGQILKGAFLFTVEVKDINWVKRGVVTILSK